MSPVKKPRDLFEMTCYKGDDIDDGNSFRYNEMNIAMRWVAECNGAQFCEDGASCALLVDGDLPEGDDPELLRKKAYGYIDMLGLLSKDQRTAAVNKLMVRTMENDLHPGKAMLKDVKTRLIIDPLVSERKWTI